MRVRPVGLHQPGALAARLQHQLPKLLLGGGVAQVTKVRSDALRQLEPRLRQHHQRHTAAVQLVVHHRRQVGAALALCQLVQWLEERLVQPAHQVFGADGAAAVVHGHLVHIGAAQCDAGLGAQADLEHIGLLRHMKTGQLHGLRREQVQLHRFEHGLALQRPQGGLGVFAVGQGGQGRKGHAACSRSQLRRHQCVVLGHLLAQLFLLFGAAHLRQHQRLGLLANVPGHHHLFGPGNGLDLHIGQGQQLGRGLQCFKISSYRRLLHKRWRLIWLKSIATKQRQRGGLGNHRRHIQRLKPHVVDQPVGQRMGGGRELCRAHMGIGPVQRLAPAPLGIGHAQHAAQQLLYRRGAAQLLQAAQHVGKGAVPAFAQGLHGDDEAHRAMARGQVQVFQPARGAGGHYHLRLRQLQFIDEVAAQFLGRHLVARVLRLEQHDGPHIAVALGLVFQRLGFQLALRLHRAKHGGGPALGVLGQHDGQLDHVLGRQLLCAHVVEHIGLGFDRRGRELQDARGVQPLQRREALVRLGVVRLVHDDDGPVQRQPVGQAPARLAHKARQDAGGVLRHVLGRHHRIGQRVQAGQVAPALSALALRQRVFEVRLKRLGKAVHIALPRVVDAKALDGGHHNHHGLPPPLRRGHLGHIV